MYDVICCIWYFSFDVIFVRNGSWDGICYYVEKEGMVKMMVDKNRVYFIDLNIYDIVFLI